MCQQGWIMHTLPLPLFSSLPLHLLSSVVRLSFHHSCHIWRHLHLPLHPSPSSSPPSMQKRASFLYCCCCCCRCFLAVLWSTLLSNLTANSFFSSLMRFFCFLWLKFCRVSSAEVSAHCVTGDTCSFYSADILHWKWLNVLMHTANYPIIEGRSAAIDSVWQLHPWVTGVIKRVGLTGKMADKAGDKLPHQNLEKEWAPSTLKCTVSQQ